MQLLLLQKLTGLGFHSPTVIQQHGWPYLMAGNHVIRVVAMVTGVAYRPQLPAGQSQSYREDTHLPATIVVSPFNIEYSQEISLGKRPSLCYCVSPYQ